MNGILKREDQRKKRKEAKWKWLSVLNILEDAKVQNVRHDKDEGCFKEKKLD